MSSSEVLIRLTAGGIFRPEDRSNERKTQNFALVKQAHVTVLFQLLHSCTLLQTRLLYNKLNQNEARNIISGYMDIRNKTITCTTMKKTNLRQFKILIRIIILISMVHFPNEPNQK